MNSTQGKSGKANQSLSRTIFTPGPNLNRKTLGAKQLSGNNSIIIQGTGSDMGQDNDFFNTNSGNKVTRLSQREPFGGGALNNTMIDTSRRISVSPPLSNNSMCKLIPFLIRSHYL